MITLLILFLELVNSNSIYDDNLFVMILSTSNQWYNYRQGSNSLMVYQQLKANGIKDQNILLMIAEHQACNPRNNEPGIISMYDDSIYPNNYCNIELDYKHTGIIYKDIILQKLQDVSVTNLLDILQNKYPANIPESKKWHLNKNSKILIILNGHYLFKGGDQFLKMQDTHVVSNDDFGKSIQELESKKLYQEILMISDSCEAFTLFDKVTAKNIMAIGSSVKGDKSYSLGVDDKIQLSKKDKFSYFTSEFLKHKFSGNKSLTIQDWMDVIKKEILDGPYGLLNRLQKQNLTQILMKDFFFNNQKKIISYSNSYKKNNKFEELKNAIFQQNNQNEQQKVNLGQTAANQNDIAFEEQKNIQNQWIQTSSYQFI